MCFIVPSSPTSGHRTLKLRGLNHREHASCRCAEVVRWSSGVAARKSYQRHARVRAPILTLSARGGLGPAPFGDRSARFAKPPANDCPVVLGVDVDRGGRQRLALAIAALLAISQNVVEQEVGGDCRSAPPATYRRRSGGPPSGGSPPTGLPLVGWSTSLSAARW